MVMTMLYLMTSPEAVPVQIENALGSLLNRVIIYLTQWIAMDNRGGHWVTKMSSRGHSYRVWEFAVPRIEDAFLQCVVYLYPDRPSACAGKQAGGSGFLVGLPVKGLEHLDCWLPL